LKKSQYLKRAKQGYLGVMLFFLYAPIAVLIAYSFNTSRSRANWGGFTLRWYAELFTAPAIRDALLTTLTVGLLSALAATIIGTAVAVGLNSMRGGFGKRALLSLTNVYVVSPDIVIGISLMVLFIYGFGFLGRLLDSDIRPLGYHTLLLAHIIFCIPFVVLSVLPKLRQLDKNLLEAALDLGAKPLYAFMRVILPQIMPGVITGAMLAFTLSIDDFVVSFFTAGAGVTNLSILIFSMARRGINPTINALSTIMFLVVMLMLYLINRRERKELAKVSMRPDAKRLNAKRRIKHEKNI
jgi:spermidine/putrescine transport system permease protein